MCLWKPQDTYQSSSSFPAEVWHSAGAWTCRVWHIHRITIQFYTKSNLHTLQPHAMNLEESTVFHVSDDCMQVFLSETHCGGCIVTSSSFKICSGFCEKSLRMIDIHKQIYTWKLKEYPSRKSYYRRILITVDWCGECQKKADYSGHLGIYTVNGIPSLYNTHQIHNIIRSLKKTH